MWYNFQILDNSEKEQGVGVGGGQVFLLRFFSTANEVSNNFLIWTSNSHFLIECYTFNVCIFLLMK